MNRQIRHKDLLSTWRADATETKHDFGEKYLLKKTKLIIVVFLPMISTGASGNTGYRDNKWFTDDAN